MSECGVMVRRLNTEMRLVDHGHAPLQSIYALNIAGAAKIGVA